MRNRQSKSKSGKSQVKVYPPKQEKKPIDKKAFMGKKKNCLTNLWFIRNERLMKQAKNDKPQKTKQIYAFLGGILLTLIGDTILDAFKLTVTYEKIINVILYIFHFIGL